MPDPKLLDDFMHRFYGYGSWNAKLWFIGMEEGGGNDEKEIDRRLAAWDRTDDLADLQRFHAAIGGTDWFSERAPIQSTWGKLIRVALAAEGRSTATDAVRRYQRMALGRDGKTALIELLPLPSPSTNHWPYASSGVDGLATRKEYGRKMLPLRSKAIANRIGTNTPSAVVFYGLGYRDYWEKISGTTFAEHESGRFETAESSSTLFVLAPHPVARGVRNTDFEAIGELIGARRDGFVKKLQRP